MFGIPQGRPHGDSDNQAGRGAAFALYGASAAAALFTGAASGRPYLGESAASLYSLSIPSDLLPPMNVMGGQPCLLTYPSADRLLVCPIHPLRFYPESAIPLLYSIGFCHPVRAFSSSAWDPVIASHPYPVGPPPCFGASAAFPLRCRRPNSGPPPICTQPLYGNPLSSARGAGRISAKAVRTTENRTADFPWFSAHPSKAARPLVIQVLNRQGIPPISSSPMGKVDGTKIPLVLFMDSWYDKSTIKSFLIKRGGGDRPDEARQPAATSRKVPIPAAQCRRMRWKTHAPGCRRGAFLRCFAE